MVKFGFEDACEVRSLETRAAEDVKLCWSLGVGSLYCAFFFKTEGLLDEMIVEPELLQAFTWIVVLPCCLEDVMSCFLLLYMIGLRFWLRENRGDLHLMLFRDRATRL